MTTEAPGTASIDPDGSHPVDAVNPGPDREVVNVLSQEDTRRLAQLERQLRRDDPAFVARMLDEPEHRGFPLSILLLAAPLWAGAFVLMAVSWWAAAVVAAMWATVIVCAVAYRCRPAHRTAGPPAPPAW